MRRAVAEAEARARRLRVDGAGGRLRWRGHRKRHRARVGVAPRGGGCRVGHGVVAAGGVGPRRGSGGGRHGGGTDGGTAAAAATAQFGDRSLERGDCGNDVETLNWLLRAARLRRRAGQRASTTATHDSVRDFQRPRGLRRTGVVEQAHPRGARRAAWARQKASWYGPGFYGNRTACGQTLQRKTGGRRAPEAAVRDQGRDRATGALRAHPGDRPRAVREARATSATGTSPRRSRGKLALRGRRPASVRAADQR